MEKRDRWMTWQTTAALLGAISMTGGCAASPEPQTAVPRSEPAVAAASDTLSDEVVAEAAASQGLDVDSVVAAKHETERRIEELDPATQREFSAMFGTDPLGLASHPDNARKYDIPLEMNERVEAWIDYFENRIPERFGLYLERKGRYEEMILAKLRVAGLPEDLLYLSLIESGMNANAYSRARAVGLWQFIRGTARMYGLETSYWVDERRDPEKATEAAIRFLSDLYDEFGSWYLAAAGYNGGPGRVRRGIARTGSDDFWVMSRTLRSETRNYVPKLIAAAIIGHDPERYGFSGLVKTKPEEYEIVEVPDATSFDVLAEAAGTDEQTLRLLNAQYLRGVTPPDRRVELKVPRGNGQRFAVAYAAIPPEERVTWTMHTITRGQTLGQLAGRYGTSVEAIRAANGNVNPRRLQIGQQLVIPRSPSTQLAVRTGPGTATPGVERTEGPVTITVRRGDTLWAIARRYAVSTRQLMAWNDLATSTIRPGDRLEIRTTGR